MTIKEMEVMKNTATGRKAMLLRLDPAVHAALAEWAEEDSRSLNSHIELLLRDDLAGANRLPANVQPLRRPGRPPLTTYK
ncbi:MAG: toxin-antitoxin system HicB family antitoxin [Propionibacteriaceae bacterium]|nr:toxin-antitoxin system HicB family antitoxin [Propionibacteriaceae bacterium]